MADQTPFHPHASGTLVDIVVQPRASTSEITGVHDGVVRLRIAAPPVDGAANSAVIALMSKTLHIRKSEMQIVSGHSGRRKRLLIRGLDVDVVQRALTSV